MTWGASAATWFRRLAHIQTRHAGAFVLISVVLAAAAVPVALRLELNSAFTALLPEDEPSVRDLRELRDRVGGLQTLTVAVQSDDLEAMQRFARDLVPRVRNLESGVVRSVDWNVGTYERFVLKHRHLYADLDTLRDARDKLEERLKHEKAQANPFHVQLADEEPPQIDALVNRLESHADEEKDKLERFPGGFYVHPDGDLLALFVRANLRGGDASGATALMSDIREEVNALQPSSYADDLRVEFAGSLVIAREEHRALAREMLTAVVITICTVLAVILAFFRRPRSILLLGGAMVTPVCLTFAFAEWTVDYLNTSTVFLGSIVIGNGINPNIIWLARYFEERRKGRALEISIGNAHHGTWLATLVASLAAALAYSSLVITDFRGFRDFGIIGGTGMILCWVGALVNLPAIAAAFERVKELRFSGAERARRPAYGLVFAKMVRSAPMPIVVGSAVAGATVLGFAAYAVSIQWDPIEYNFKNLKSVREGSTRAKEINDRVGDIVGSTAQGNAIVMVVPDRKQAAQMDRRLERLRDERDAPWESVRSIWDLLPSHQREKKHVLGDIRELMQEIRPHVKPARKNEIDEHLPPASLATLKPGDLPEDVARPFTERDGTRGRILLVENQKGRSIWDGRYLVEWARELRDVRTEDGSRPPLAGRAPVFADIISAIWVDGPKAILASFAATVLLVLVAFRRLRAQVLTITALLLGVLWMGGLMALLGMRLNFLNFVAFPITFGNGVDYAVNVMRRHTREEHEHNPDPVRTSVEETGGAVILCSLTTIIGYASLYASANQALNSFGLAMAISEVTCLAAALVTVPALLSLLQRRGAGRTGGAARPLSPVREPERVEAK